MILIHEKRVEDLIAETLSMTAFTKEPATMDVPDALAERLTTMNVYLARSGEIYAESKLLLTEQTAWLYARPEAGLADMKATEAKRAVATATRRTAYLEDLAERLNHNLVHEGNNIRRQLQYIQDQMHAL